MGDNDLFDTSSIFTQASVKIKTLNFKYLRGLQDTDQESVFLGIVYVVAHLFQALLEPQKRLVVDLPAMRTARHRRARRTLTTDADRITVEIKSIPGYARLGRVQFPFTRMGFEKLGPESFFYL